MGCDQGSLPDHWSEVIHHLNGKTKRERDWVGRPLDGYPQLNRVMWGIHQILFGSKYRSVVWTEACPSSSWICSSSPPAARQSLAHDRRDAGQASICRIPLKHLPNYLFGHGLSLYPVASINGRQGCCRQQWFAGASKAFLQQADYASRCRAELTVYRREPVTFNMRIPRARPERGVSAHYETLTSCSTPKHHNLRALSGIKSPDAPCFIEGHSRPLPVKLRGTYASDNSAFCEIPGAG